MNTIKDNYQTRPKLALGFAATLAVFLFVTLVPFSYTRTTGFQATISVAADAEPVSPRLAEGVLAALGFEQARVALKDGEALTISNLSNENEAYLLARTIVQLSGADAIAQVDEEVEVKRTPLLAQVVERVRLPERKPVGIKFHDGHLVLNGEELDRGWASKHASDRSVRRAIEEILRRYLAEEEDVNVDVSTNFDTTLRIIRLTVGDHLNVAVDEPDMALYIRPDREIWATLDTLDDSIRSRIELEFPGKTVEGRSVLIKVELDGND